MYAFSYPTHTLRTITTNDSAVLGVPRDNFNYYTLKENCMSGNLVWSLWMTWSKLFMATDFRYMCMLNKPSSINMYLSKLLLINLAYSI